MPYNLDAFFRGDYMPHGHCYLWQPGILWSNVISDLLIALAYFSIPVALVMILRRREDLKFRGLFMLFSCFILFCGITHLVAVYTVWHGSYGMQGMIKAATAIVSITAAVALFSNLQRVLAYPSLEQLRAAEHTAHEEKLRRQQLELQRKNDAIFKFTTELVPTGLLVVDEHQRIRMANRALEKMFGYDDNELSGRHLHDLVPDNFSKHHDSLAANYVNNPTQDYAMAAGRAVRGWCKNGETISIEIRLSVHEFEGEKYTFASIMNLGQILSEQQLLNETSRRIRRAIEATDDGIWEWNPQTDDVWFSPRMKAMLGQPDNGTDDIEQWRQHIHPDDQQAVSSNLQQHFDIHTKLDVVYRGMISDNRYEWLHLRGDTLFDEQHKPLLISGTLSNIHQLKTLEQELEDKSRFLNEVLDHSLCGLYIYNFTTGSNRYINPEYTRITGYTLADLEQFSHPASMLQLFHPQDRESVLQHFERVKHNRGQQALSIEYRIQHKQGHWVWCYSRDSLYARDAQGQPLEMLGTFFDISALKQRENEMRELAQDFFNTFEQAAVGIAHIDLDGQFLKVNRKLCDILGYSQQSLLEKNLLEVTHEEDGELSRSQRQQLIEGDIDQYVIEKRYIRSTGEVIWVNLTVAIVREPKVARSYFISVIEDISTRKRMELDLADSNHALERFAYSASHDLQEPLRKISAFADVLENRLKGKISDPDINFQLERISDASRRMGLMIQSLLQLSRYSRKDLIKTPASLAHLLSQVTDDLSTLISSQGATIHLDSDMTLCVEPNGFQQVLRNLITNSIQYARDDQPPRIDISIQQTEERQMIQLTDNGQGLEVNHIQHIFEPFRRFSHKYANGTGMGLAICRQILKAHGGSIHAENRKSGSGTVMYLEIPRS